MFRKIRTIILVFILINISFGAKAQEIQELAPQVPTSPQAEAFKQYGEYAINYSTGIPDISIPLYEINHRGYRLPLVLKYNPKPLKPGYNYDVYGHGWGLSVHSSISRSIEFCPDEWKDFELEEDLLDSDYYPCPGCPPLNLSNYNFARDKFNVVLPNGSSFDFVMEKIDGNIEYTVSDGRQVKITSSYNTSNINSFTVIDEDGVKYTFNGSDTPHRIPVSQISNSYVSWQLTRIDLPYSSQPINFTYDYWIQGPLACQESRIKISHRHPEMGPDDVSAQNTENVIPYSYRMKLLSSISYGNSSIAFVYQNPNSTLDLTEQYNYVDKIQVRRGTGVLKEIILDKSKKSVANNCSSNTEIAKLDSITIKGSDASANPQVYKFTYSSISGFSGTDHWGNLNRFDTRYNVANFNFFVSFDAVYYNVVNSASISLVAKTAQDLSPYDKLKLAQSNNNIDIRQPSGPETHGVLTRLIYPTGGYTDFEFENHEFLTSTDNNGNYILDRDNRRKIKAGGFRIRKLTNFTAEGNVAKIMNYRYGKTYGEIYGPDYVYANHHTGVGEAVVDPNILTYMNHSYYFRGLPKSIKFMILGLAPNGQPISFLNPFDSERKLWEWECTFSASNFRGIVNGRPPVLYSEVTVYHGDINQGSDSYSPELTTGKTVYKYNLTDHGFDLFGVERDDLFFEEPYYNGNTIVYNPKGYRYNNIIEQLDYKFDPTVPDPQQSKYRLVKKEQYDWIYSYNNIMDYVINDKYPPGAVSAAQNSLVYEYLVTKPTVLGISKMSLKVTTLYNSGETFSYSEGYSYNSRDQLSSKTIANSNGNSIQNIYSYPQVVPNVTPPDIIQEMVEKNIISPVIEKITKVGGETSAGSKVDYQEFTIGASKIIMPARVYELEIEPSGSEYALKNQINDYSANGNPLEHISPEGIRSSYMWGYNDRYMVIKADNIDYSALANIVEASLPAGFATLEELLPQAPNSAWVQFNENLRANVPANAMITTYTYSPLIGITSSTDPNNITTYYEYDSFGRLQSMKDHEENIVQQYEYHYQNK